MWIIKPKYLINKNPHKANFFEAPYDDRCNDVVSSSDYVPIANSSRRDYKTKIRLYFYSKKSILENSSLNLNVIKSFSPQFSMQLKRIYFTEVLFTLWRKELRLYRSRRHTKRT